MTTNKHLKDTARRRSGYHGISYQQARREIQRELDRLAPFDHLPIIWETGRPRTRLEIPSQESHRAALGAVQLAFRDCSIMVGATDQDRWRTLDGHIDLDWTGGAFAHEVVLALLGQAEGPNSDTLHQGEVRPGLSAVGDLNSVWIGGVRVRFRPARPIGHAVSLKRHFAGLRAPLQSS